MNSTSRKMRTGFGSLIVTISLVLVGAFHADATMPPRYAAGQIDLDDPTRVDIALVLAVDVSSSIKSHERRFQREAYAAALADTRVADMALGGGSGRVAIAYMEWSGTRYQRVLLPMRIMSSHAELAQFAQDIRSIQDAPSDPMFVQPTAVGDALLAAETAMSELNVQAHDYVIDISGDGVVNDGSGVAVARERLLAMGLTVNGLPIEISGDELGLEQASFDQVAQFYADCVIGGPGAFHLIARGFGDVRETLIMKLMLEMAQLDPEEKRRIAAAWNNVGHENRHARLAPAIALQLAPTETPEVPKADCGSSDARAVSPFDMGRN